MSRTTLALAVMGSLLGFSLSRMGFASWDEVNRMFTVEDPRLYLSFGLGVTLLGLAFWAIKRTRDPGWPPRPIEKGTLAGGVVFGIGWALSGACPGVALVQIGEGKLYALITLAGMLLGNWLYGVVSSRRAA